VRVVAIANQKGGCGKTTTSINLAASLVHLGKKVLLIDLDPQGHSSCGLGVSARELPYSIYDLLSPAGDETLTLDMAVESLRGGLDIVPSYEILSSLEEELANRVDKEFRLRTLLKNLRQEDENFERYDFVIMDCPPNLGVLTYNAFWAADEIVIPVEPSFFSLHGLAKISETIHSLNERRLDAIEIHALLTLFNSRTSFAEEVYAEVRKHFRERLFKTIIHEDEYLKEAAGAGKSIVDYHPGAMGYRDYMNLAVEFLERQWDRNLPENHLGWEKVYRERYGPKKVCGGVLFQFLDSKAREVELAGDFNNWIPEPLICRGEPGLWQKIIPLESGTYRYKFIVDGEWQVDPGHEETKTNVFGGYDSCLEVM